MSLWVCGNIALSHESTKISLAASISIIRHVLAGTGGVLCLDVLAIRAKKLLERALIAASLPVPFAMSKWAVKAIANTAWINFSPLRKRLHLSHRPQRPLLPRR
jgi:hypothetical protein